MNNIKRGLICQECRVIAVNAESMRCDRPGCPGDKSFDAPMEGKAISVADYLYETALIFAARYAHGRNTAAAFTVVRAIQQAWPLLSEYARIMILRESHEAAFNLDDWERLREWADEFKKSKKENE